MYIAFVLCNNICQASSSSLYQSNVSKASAHIHIFSRKRIGYHQMYHHKSIDMPLCLLTEKSETPDEALVLQFNNQKARKDKGKSVKKEKLNKVTVVDIDSLLVKINPKIMLIEKLSEECFHFIGKHQKANNSAEFKIHYDTIIVAQIWMQHIL